TEGIIAPRIGLVLPANIGRLHHRIAMGCRLNPGLLEQLVGARGVSVSAAAADLDAGLAERIFEFALLEQGEGAGSRLCGFEGAHRLLVASIDVMSAAGVEVVAGGQLLPARAFSVE